MYNPALSAYRNLPIAKDTSKPKGKSFGLLSRDKTATRPVSGSKQPRERVAEYVMDIRKEREKLKNG
jgi:hypothetical protein